MMNVKTNKTDSSQTVDRLWRMFRQTPSEATMVALLEHYMPLVRRTVKSMAIYTPPDMDVDDLIQHALMGLCTAIQRCDERRQYAFASFATQRIRGSVRDALRRHDPLSRTDRALLRQIEQKTQDYLACNREAPDEQTLAEAMGLTTNRVRSLMARAQAWVSLESVVHADGQNEDGVLLGDVLPDEEARDPARETERHDQAASFRRVFRRLPDRQRKLLYLYYYEDLTLKEIGAIFELTEARISQIHAAALLTLKALLAESATGS